RAARGRVPCRRCEVFAHPERLGSSGRREPTMINAAIVGLGWWGKTLVESVQASSDSLRFVAGATRTVSPEAEAFAAEHELRLLVSLEALLDDPAVDAVVLATPHSLHAQQVIAAAEAGKHVFCEKPFTLTKADAEAAVAATRRSGVA